MGLKDLAHRDRTAGGGLTRSTGRPVSGPGADITAVTFAGRAITYADIPTVFRAGAAAAGTALVPVRTSGKTTPGSALVRPSKVSQPQSQKATEKVAKQVIASGARQIEKPRRSGGRVVQRRVGWQATPTVIIITTAERELREQPDKRYAPAGEWLVEHRMTYPCMSGPADKRVGRVPFDIGGDSQSEPEPVGLLPSSPGPDAFPEGSAALAFLPSSVRASVLARVPNPTVFDGTVLQFSEEQSGKVHHQEVNVIRMDAATAVVVQARRDPDATVWEVSQAVYALGEPEVEQV